MRLLGPYPSQLTDFYYQELSNMLQADVAAGAQAGGALFDRQAAEDLVAAASDFNSLPGWLSGSVASSDDVNRLAQVLQARYASLLAEIGSAATLRTRLLALLASEGALIDQLRIESAINSNRTARFIAPQTSELYWPPAAGNRWISPAAPASDPFTGLVSSGFPASIRVVPLQGGSAISTPWVPSSSFAHDSYPASAASPSNNVFEGVVVSSTVNPQVIKSLDWTYDTGSSEREILGENDWSSLGLLFDVPRVSYSAPQIQQILPLNTLANYLSVTGSAPAGIVPTYIRIRFTPRQRQLSSQSITGSPLALSKYAIDPSSILIWDPVSLTTYSLGVQTQDGSTFYYDPNQPPPVFSANLLIFTEGFDNTAWHKDGTSSVAPNTTANPNGQVNADTFTLGSGLSQWASLYQNLPITGTPGAYTFSIWLRSVSGTVGAQLGISDLGSNNLLGAVQTVTTTWQRYTFPVAAGALAATGSISAGIKLSGSAGTQILAWGAQLEAASSASTYIPVTGAQAPYFYDYSLTGSTITFASKLTGQTLNIAFTEMFPGYECSTNDTDWSPLVWLDPDNPNPEGSYPRLRAIIPSATGGLPVTDEMGRSSGLYVSIAQTPLEEAAYLITTPASSSVGVNATLTIEISPPSAINALHLEPLATFPATITGIVAEGLSASQQTTLLGSATIDFSRQLDLYFPSLVVGKLHISLRQENYSLKTYIQETTDQLRREALLTVQSSLPAAAARIPYPEPVVLSGTVYEFGAENVRIENRATGGVETFLVGPLKITGTPDVVYAKALVYGYADLYLIYQTFDAAGVLAASGSHPMVSDTSWVFPSGQASTYTNFYLKVVLRGELSVCTSVDLQATTV